MVVVVLGTWGSLSMSGTGIGAAHSYNVQRVMGGIMSGHAGNDNACCCLFFLRSQSQITLELEKRCGQQMNHT